MAKNELKASELRNVCDPSVFPFKTTEDYVFETEPLHQERGVNSIDFGLNVRADGYNIFVSGAGGTGRNTQVNKAVNEIAYGQKTPDDWIYVYNFIQEDEPVAVCLPAGRGRNFKLDMEEMLGELQVEIPKAFDSEDYETRKHELIREYKKKRDVTLQDIEDKSFKEGFVLKQSVTGVILVPRDGDEPMTNEDYDGLSISEREKIEKKKHELHIKIEQVLSEVRSLEKGAKQRLKGLEKEVALFSVKHIIDELRFKYREFEDIVEYLNRVQEDILDNIDAFKEEEAEPGAMPLFGMKPPPKTNVFLKYRVNLLVDHRNSEGAPIVKEANPSYYNLLGRIEYVSQLGSTTTDFTMIAAGALHKANGGYLILQAMDIFKNYMAWEALKRVIRDKEIRVEDINEQFRLISTTSLKPKPIPCDIKIVMVGPAWLYQMLYRFDEEFRKMFKIKADFDVEMTRDDEMLKKYAAFIKVRCDDEKLRHFERGAVARVIEYGSRLAENKDKLSALFMYIANILREADYWAAKDHKDYVERDHVERAIREKIYRSSLIEEKILELIDKNVLMIDVEGEKVGQVNGLAVLDVGEYAFGKPSRITVRTYMGKQGLVDIERQVKMGGNVHSKGVMILSGHLGEKFAQDAPLSLCASICFEQSYQGVDGDSASSTEMYCLLSSLSDVPLKQSIAVTGSMNQHGMVQPIGGANEKIEGFYHVCKLSGLTGDQGVMIPAANMKHLMLKDEVVEAVKKKKFHIWVVSTLDEGIEILTGKKAGKADSKGKYPKGTINYLAAKKLQEYSDKFSAQKGKKKAKKKKK